MNRMNKGNLNVDIDKFRKINEIISEHCGA
ncbi:conserved protein of unknown function [Paenibacillus alvei]|uniref:Uncharacterized protein n=1 Tax=Paenibacillus alvei TaxID=44250 RepID=A0A383RCW8_PAEAL|nr:conserved protein of unknown function [Paenibacillus alvei]